jgi:iron complex transport system substrate-binding protein
MVRRVQQDKIIMQRMKAAVMAATHGKGETRRTMFVVDTNKIWNVHSNLAYTPSLLQAIGIPPANTLPYTKDNIGNPYIVMSQEDLLSNNPDIIFVANNPPNPIFDKWSQSPLWGQINAVKNKQVYVVNANLWSKARGLAAGELIAQQAVHLLYHKYVSIKLPGGDDVARA